MVKLTLWLRSSIGRALACHARGRGIETLRSRHCGVEERLPCWVHIPKTCVRITPPQPICSIGEIGKHAGLKYQCESFSVQVRNRAPHAGVAKLVKASDLKSVAKSIVGSNPITRTKGVCCFYSFLTNPVNRQKKSVW